MQPGNSPTNPYAPERAAPALQPRPARWLLLIAAAWLGLLVTAQLLELVVCVLWSDYPAVPFRLFFH